MYLHLGGDVVVRLSELVGIFDMENTSTAKGTRDFLGHAQREGHVVVVSDELPKSFVVACGPDGNETVYITQISSTTLRRRLFSGRI